MHFGSPRKNSSGVEKGRLRFAANLRSPHEKSFLAPVRVCVCVWGGGGGRVVAILYTCVIHNSSDYSFSNKETEQEYNQYSTPI